MLKRLYRLNFLKKIRRWHSFEVWTNRIRSCYKEYNAVWKKVVFSKVRVGCRGLRRLLENMFFSQCCGTYNNVSLIKGAKQLCFFYRQHIMFQKIQHVQWTVYSRVRREETYSETDFFCKLPQFSVKQVIKKTTDASLAKWWLYLHMFIQQRPDTGDRGIVMWLLTF